MKKLTAFFLTFLCLCLLTGCEKEEIPHPETTVTPIYTEVVTVPTDPAPTEPISTEPEKIKELLVAEEYYYTSYVEDIPYQRYLTLYPNSHFYSAGWAGDSSRGTYVQDEEGRIVMKNRRRALCVQKNRVYPGVGKWKFCPLQRFWFHRCNAGYHFQKPIHKHVKRRHL